MGKEQSPFEILGVPLGSSKEEITRAYRSLIVRYHPDKRPDDGTFLRIQNAYEELKKVGFKTSQKSEPIAPLWRGNLRISLEIPLQEIAECREKTLTYTKKILCRKCKRIKCSYCGGTGRDPISLIMGPKRPCRKCRGISYVRDSNGCTSCGDKGFLERKSSVSMKLNPMINGPVVFRDKGNEIEEGCGDLIVDILIKKDETYQASGLSLKRSLDITPVQAVIGDNIQLDMWGKTVNFQIPPGTQNNEIVKKSGAGMTWGSRSGDLHVTVKIRIPKIISADEREIYEQILKIEKENICRNL